MADRYEDRYRGQAYRGDRGYGRDERGFVERAGDEVRSWFGDDEARRRRRMDEREYDRGRDDDRWRSHEGDRGERGWSGSHWPDRDASDRWGSERERGWTGERTGRWTGDYARSGYGGREDDSRGNYGAGGSGWSTASGFGYGPGIWSSETSAERSWSPAGESRYESGRGIEGGRQESWRPRGFAGRGPKGYQRSDSRIHEDVCDRLAEAFDVDASEIEVTVRNGEVTLAGAVPDRTQKRRSEDLIENVTGVREVHNNLRVASGQGLSQTSPGSSMGSGQTAPPTPQGRR
jgi:osmotically-inducible protein OsmY